MIAFRALVCLTVWYSGLGASRIEFKDFADSSSTPADFRQVPTVCYACRARSAAAGPRNVLSVWQIVSDMSQDELSRLVTFIRVWLRVVYDVYSFMFACVGLQRA